MTPPYTWYYSVAPVWEFEEIEVAMIMLTVLGTSSVTWSMSVRNLSEMEQSSAELLTILQFFVHVMWRGDLDLWPLDLEFLRHFSYHAFKVCTVCTKFERNRIINGWVIDDLARVRRAIMDGAQLTQFSQGCADPTSRNLAKA